MRCFDLDAVADKRLEPPGGAVDCVSLGHLEPE
jgi:hypothetical protein